MLTYAQQSKEVANIEQDKLAKRIQEYRTQTEVENIPMPGADGTQPVGLNSYKNFEAGMQSATKGEASNSHFLVNIDNSPVDDRYIVFYLYFDVLFSLAV